MFYMSNEITVKLKCSIDEICNILENKNFKILDKYVLEDTYFIPKELKINNMECREILKHCILLRRITENKNKKKTIKITKKIKDINSLGEIIRQKNIDCEILNEKEGIDILHEMNYKELINILENDIEYEKNGLKVLIKDVKNGDKLLEVETQDNKNLNSIEKIKQKINELGLPIDTKDYFVKKAEIEIKKIL